MVQNLELASLLLRTADYLLQRAQYGQAEPLYLRALHIREQSLGREHPQVAFPLGGLAELYQEQGHYQQAEPLYQRALHLWEPTLGSTHLKLRGPPGHCSAREVPHLLGDFAGCVLSQH